MKHILSIALAAALPVTAFAAGDGDAPSTTNTTKTCKKGEVWDKKTKACVKVESSNHLDDNTLYDAARELAYVGRADEAQVVLSAMRNQTEDRVLTYWGFTHRKLGNLELANMFYDRAISQNPDNILARSYMAQGLVSEGKYDLARAQLSEIRARGGRNTWAEASLRLALQSGQTFDY